MRSLAVVSIVLGLTGCVLLETEHESPPLPPRSDECAPNGLCTTKRMPFKFAQAAIVGVSTEFDLAFAAHSSIASQLEIVASDPEVLDLELIGAQSKMIVRAKRAGSASVIARDVASKKIFASVPISASDIATFGWSWRARPVASDPLPAIAGLAHSTDDLGLALRSAEGQLLEGHAPIAIADPEIASLVELPIHLPSMFEGWDLRERVGVRFGDVGMTTITMTLLDGRVASLPIEVVADIDRLELVVARLDNGGPFPAPATFATNEMVGVAAVGRTADGRFVAGVQAIWTSTLPGLLDPDPQATPDFAFWVTEPRTVDVTATSGRHVATTRIVTQ
jgi:hypothetical protein